MRWRPLAGAVFLIVAASAANAQTAVPCEQFGWPVTRERALFAAATLPTVGSGETIKLASTQAVRLKLKRLDEVQFTRAPERRPKNPESFAGLLEADSIQQPGLYQVTLSQEAWVDVIQNDAFVKSTAHSGKRGCAEVRKSVRFELGKGPAVIQISGVDADTIDFAILPVVGK
jgi:hypothetical protein